MNSIDSLWRRRRIRFPTRMLAGGFAVMLVVLLAPGWTYWQSLNHVQIVVDGQAQVVRTRARDVAALFAQIGYRPRPEDQVSLPAEPLSAQARLVIRRARPIRVEADGYITEYWTRATTLGQFLAEQRQHDRADVWRQGMFLGPHDQVLLAGAPADHETTLPPPVWTAPRDGLPHAAWTQTTPPLTVAIRRAIPITLLDGDSAPATFSTLAATVGEALAVAETPIYQGDAVFPPLASRLQPGQRIVIQRSLPLTVQVDGRTLATRSRRKTVGDALGEMGAALVGLDRVAPPLYANLRAYTDIRVTRVREDVIYEEQHIPFQVVFVADDNLPIDQQRIVNSGSQGILRSRYRLRYEDGVEIGRDLEDKWTAATPQNKVIAYGRKIEPITIDSPDGPITYWRKMRVYTTSYSPARSGTPPSAPWYGRTRIGLTLSKGLVAVDPSVIPMRQRLYVPGYGLALAADTGGGVKGRFVDLGYDDANYQSWHWWTDIYLLWPPPPAYSINYMLPNYPRYPDRRR